MISDHVGGRSPTPVQLLYTGRGVGNIYTGGIGHGSRTDCGPNGQLGGRPHGQAWGGFGRKPRRLRCSSQRTTMKSLTHNLPPQAVDWTGKAMDSIKRVYGNDRYGRLCHCW
jgi:hypothetical protein